MRRARLPSRRGDARERDARKRRRAHARDDRGRARDLGRGGGSLWERRRRVRNLRGGETPGQRAHAGGIVRCERCAVVHDDRGDDGGVHAARGARRRVLVRDAKESTARGARVETREIDDASHAHRAHEAMRGTTDARGEIKGTSLGAHELVDGRERSVGFELERDAECERDGDF